MDNELPRRKRKRRSLGPTLLVILTSFILGLVVGMVIIHNKSSKEIAAVKDELATVIEEQSHINVTNVYVPKRKITEGLLSLSSYNPDNFRIDDGFMAYFDDDGNKISHLGCDLSYHNKYVNWDELAASGCEFVMLRCGYRGYSEGGLAKDEKFDLYASEAQRVGLKLGVYFFTQAVTVEEAEEEAKYVLDLIENYNISYPVAFDTEYIDDDSARTNTVEISDELRSDICRAFCEKIREKGYYPMLYASENWMRRYLELESLREYDFWAPQYLEENDFLFDFTMWQYTDCGSIQGVKGDVDLDISMVDYASFVPQMREAYLTGGKIEAKGEDLVIKAEKEEKTEETDPETE
ncbi:MAG: glycoside hydrolase family 25 protein [Lachnospiraceae bacterium]|nr:glycoside hydrolase family 25 protein [Lachnospiraceae bacterium]